VPLVEKLEKDRVALALKTRGQARRHTRLGEAC
jgi:hypothetical protein